MAAETEGNLTVLNVNASGGYAAANAVILDEAGRLAGGGGCEGSHW